MRLDDFFMRLTVGLAILGLAYLFVQVIVL